MVDIINNNNDNILNLNGNLITNFINSIEDKKSFLFSLKNEIPQGSNIDYYSHLDLIEEYIDVINQSVQAVRSLEVENINLREIVNGKEFKNSSNDNNNILKGSNNNINNNSNNNSNNNNNIEDINKNLRFDYSNINIDEEEVERDTNTINNAKSTYNKDLQLSNINNEYNTISPINKSNNTNINSNIISTTNKNYNDFIKNVPYNINNNNNNNNQKKDNKSNTSNTLDYTNDNKDEKLNKSSLSTNKVSLRHQIKNKFKSSNLSSNNNSYIAAQNNNNNNNNNKDTITLNNNNNKENNNNTTTNNNSNIKENSNNNNNLTITKLTNSILRKIPMTENNKEFFSGKYTNSNSYKDFLQNIIDYKYTEKELNDINLDIESIEEEPKTLVETKNHSVLASNGFNFNYAKIDPKPKKNVEGPLQPFENCLRKYDNKVKQYNNKKEFNRFNKKHGEYFDSNKIYNSNDYLDYVSPKNNNNNSNSNINNSYISNNNV